MKSKYALTLRACALGYIVQAVVNNLLPLLFVYFNQTYKIPLYLISLLIAYNFAVQIIVDSYSAKLTIKLGHRKTAILSCMLSFIGLLILGVTPFFLKGSISLYVGIVTAVTFMAVGGGIIEVILSPLIEALPLENKSAQMNMLHAYYCVGHIIVVVLSTLFFWLFGINNYPYLAILLTILPIITAILFAKCLIIAPCGDENPIKISGLFKNKVFIIIFILMIMAGASEQAVACWISFFAESGLGIDKWLGDIIGVTFFAVAMLISRLFFGNPKRNIKPLKILPIFAVMLAVSFSFSAIIKIKILSLIVLATSGIFVGIMWPSIYSLGGEIFKYGGTVMFSMMALGGDLGCTIGPTLVGIVADVSSIDTGILISAIFPLIMLAGLFYVSEHVRKNKQENENIN